MSFQKLQIIPTVQSPVPSEPCPLVFWKRINKKHEEELHLFLLLKGRTEKETKDLGREIWERISTYLNELAINQKGFSNPEHVCESILKIGNDFLTTWSHGTQISNWGDLSLIIAVSNSAAIYFARIGKARFFLFRNQQIILADEDLSHPRSPQFSPPFSEIAGGPLKLGDRIMFASGEIMELFSWEEIATLANSPIITQAFYNMLRSLEVTPLSKNSAFLLGDAVSTKSNLAAEQEKNILLLLGDKIKDARIGEMNFLEFNPLVRQTAANPSQTLIPWQNILGEFWEKTTKMFEFLTKIAAAPFGIIRKRISSLSLTRKIILFSSLGLFLIFIGFIANSLLNRQTVPPVAETNYEANIEEAGRLKDEAANALIYQDEEKARKNLMQADILLEEASISGEWGIKAIKLRQEVGEQLSVLDKASPVEIQKIWTVAESHESIRNIALQSNRDILAATGKGIWSIKTNGGPQAEKFSKELELGENKYWIVPNGSKFLLISPQSRSLFAINAASREISDKKELAPEIKNTFSAAAAFDSSVYLFDSENSQIKQFSTTNDSLTFNRDWFKQDLTADFKDNPAVSLCIDGSIFLITKNGNIFKLSGGKKSAWSAENPASPFQGDKLRLFTESGGKNLYILDPAKKRVVLIEKETGKMLGQMQNSDLANAVDFQVDEKNKTLYFATGSDLFKLTLNL